jgi:hypothetical protein
MSNRNPKTATITKAVSVHRFKPALARLNVHSRHDRAECYAISFYTMGQEARSGPGVQRSRLGAKTKDGDKRQGPKAILTDGHNTRIVGQYN